MKKTISIVLLVTLLCTLFAGVSVLADTPALISAEPAVLEVYTQAGEDGTPALAKSYSAEELAALAETKADGYGYVYYKGGSTMAVVATEYVTLDALLTDAGVDFASGDKLSFTCTDGPYTKGDFSYDTLESRIYDTEGNTVPASFAISWDQGSLDEGTVADIAAGAYNSGSIRFVCGAAEEEISGQSAAGNRMPSGVVSVTVVAGKETVVASSQKLTVNGKTVETEVYNINGSNYFKLRDVAQLLNGTGSQFSVAYDEAARAIAVTTGAAYTPVGGELATGKDQSASCVKSSQSITVDGAGLNIAVYNIGGNNFFKLRDLGEALHFDVDYDEASRTILVTSK